MVAIYNNYINWVWFYCFQIAAADKMKATQVLCVVVLVMLDALGTVDTRPSSLVNSVADEAQTKELRTADEVKSHDPETDTKPHDQVPSEPDEVLKPAESNRRNKMLDFFGGFLPQPFMSQFQQQYYQPQQYFDPSAGYEEEDLMSRANRRKPSNRENSPIFYVRLPPTPYMYVPGMGYISQPPTIRPLAFAPPPMPPPVVNPFINVPVNFLANGKPTNVYEWPATAQVNHLAQPQYPTYLPSRPSMHQQRPQSYRPHKHSFLPDSKITHLKGNYVFNGRPEEIFVLPQNAPQSHPQQSPFGLNPYQTAFGGAHDYQTPHQQLQAQHQQQQHLEFAQQHQQSAQQPQPDYNNPYQSHQSHHNAYQHQQQLQQFGGYNPSAYQGGYNSIYSDGNYY